MKLITNFKDYYDFLIGKYGIDEKCVYERTNKYNPNFKLEPLEYKAFRIHFCNTTYFGHYYRGKFYYGKDAENHIPKFIGNADIFGKIYRGQTHDPLTWDGKKQYEYSYNEKLNCPIVLNGSHNYRQEFTGQLNVKLSDFGFGKVIEPEEAFIKISNFIMREKEIPDNQSNKEKIVSHGFDLKTSFRHPINKKL